MATLPTHALVGCAIVRLWPGEPKGWKLYVAAAAGAMLPDADVIGFRLGVDYGDVLGHRGLTHSLAFAACFGVCAALAAGSKRVALPLALAMASHGLLDAWTNGGMGVAFFSPFTNARYFLPYWRPIEVSPITVSHFFEQGGLDVLKSELVWVWIPVLVLLLWHGLRRARARNPRESMS